MKARAIGTLVFTALYVGCANAPPAEPKAAPTRAAKVEAPAAASSLTGTLTVKDGGTPRGRLVLGWRSAADQREVDAGRGSTAIFRRVMDTFTPGDTVDFGRTPSVHYSIEAPTDATPIVVLDVDHTFLPTMNGRGLGLRGTGKPGGGDIVLAANPKHEEHGEPCAGPRRKLVAVDAPELHAAATPGPRRFCAWLPKDWSERSTRRYPLVLLLPGFASSEMAYLSHDGDVGLRLDAIAAELGRDAVLVGVDTSTPLGSTYFEDSKAQGAWDTFVRTRALPVLERELHTMPKRTARALLGHSTGGHSALSYAMRHSDVFSAIGASSPDPPDIEAWMVEPGAPRARAREWVRHWLMLEDELGGPGQFASWAADWSPDATARGFAWPIDPKSGGVVEPVLERWIAKSPHGLLRDPAFRARTKEDLSGRIFIAAGKNDEFGLFEPAERFAKELEALGIATRFVATDSGHGHHQERLAEGLRFLLERLDRATP